MKSLRQSRITAAKPHNKRQRRYHASGNAAGFLDTITITTHRDYATWCGCEDVRKKRDGVAWGDAGGAMRARRSVA